MLPDVSIWTTPFSPFLHPQVASVHSVQGLQGTPSTQQSTRPLNSWHWSGVQAQGAPQELDILMAMNSEMGLPIIPCLGIVTKKRQNKQFDHNCAIRCSAFVWMGKSSRFLCSACIWKLFERFEWWSF